MQWWCEVFIGVGWIWREVFAGTGAAGSGCHQGVVHPFILF
jgi:hypothetical protein